MFIGGQELSVAPGSIPARSVKVAVERSETDGYSATFIDIPKGSWHVTSLIHIKNMIFL
jgi:hypothetical protein